MARRKKSNLVMDDQRPPAPSDMEPEAQVLWDHIVESEAPGFFKTAATQVLLAAFVRHTVQADRLYAELQSRRLNNKTDYSAIKSLEILARMYASQTAAAGDKATKLRITNQARYTPQGAGRAMRDAGEGSKPWEDDES
jgi:hypothetical protein